MDILDDCHPRRAAGGERPAANHIMSSNLANCTPFLAVGRCAARRPPPAPHRTAPPLAGTAIHLKQHVEPLREIRCSCKPLRGFLLIVVIVVVVNVVLVLVIIVILVLVVGTAAAVVVYVVIVFAAVIVIFFLFTCYEGTSKNRCLLDSSESDFVPSVRPSLQYSVAV